jgi:hypothetical protein
MKVPALIEVRYKPYKNLDYISGYSYLYSTKDLPSWKTMLTTIDDEYNEISIRILPISDLIVFAYDAYQAAEEEAERQMFYDIVGEEAPAVDYREAEKAIEIIIDDENDEEVVPYTVMIGVKAERELLELYYRLKEIDPEE